MRLCRRSESRGGFGGGRKGVLDAKVKFLVAQFEPASAARRQSPRFFHFCQSDLAYPKGAGFVLCVGGDGELNMVKCERQLGPSVAFGVFAD